MSKYDRILAEAKEEARKEIEGKDNRQEFNQDIKQEIKFDPKLASKEIKPIPKSAPKPAPMKNPFPSSKKVSCKYCGKELSPNGLFQHEKHCLENPINIAKQDMDAKQDTDAKRELKQKELVQKELEQKAMEQQEKQIGQQELDGGNADDPRPTIPLSLCARDIAHVKENKPFYMKVMGRKVGDKVYVEEVELMRL